jgi:hypothetical protein
VDHRLYRLLGDRAARLVGLHGGLQVVHAPRARDAPGGQGRSDDWIFAPEMPYERQGDVNGVVFPCGWILDEASGMTRMYYGGADSCLALATARLADVLDYIRTCPAPPQWERPGMAH